MTQKQGIWGWNNDKHYNYSFDKHWKWLQQAWTPHKSYVFTVLQINLNLLQHIAIIMAHLSVFLWLRNDVNLMFLCFYHVSRILFLRFACLIKRKSTKLWLKCTCLVSTLIRQSLIDLSEEKLHINIVHQTGRVCLSFVFSLIESMKLFMLVALFGLLLAQHNPLFKYGRTSIVHLFE